MLIPRTGLVSTLPLKITDEKRIYILFRVSELVIILLCWGDSSHAKAQQVQFGIDFTSVIPTGDFRRNVTNNGYGVGGQFLVGVGRSPLFLGADAAITTYGSEEHKEPISTTIPELRVKVRTDNNIALAHILLRAQPRTGAVRPYADGLIGIKHLFTNTRILSDSNDQEIASTKNLSDLAFSYGFGGGVQVRLARFGRNGDISLDGKARYLRGGRAEYLKRGSIRRENGAVFFDVLRSRTDVATIQIGIAFRF